MRSFLALAACAVTLGYATLSLADTSTPTMDPALSITTGGNALQVAATDPAKPADVKKADTKKKAPAKKMVRKRAAPKKPMATTKAAPPPAAPPAAAPPKPMPAKASGPMDRGLNAVGNTLERGLHFLACGLSGGPGAEKRKACS